MIVSSGASEDSDPEELDFCGETALLKYLVLRSPRPDVLDVLDEICDCDWEVRALDDRLGSDPAIACSWGRSQGRSLKCIGYIIDTIGVEEENAIRRPVGRGFCGRVSGVPEDDDAP